MPLNNSQFQLIMHSYEDKQSRNRLALKERYEEVCRLAPDYRELDGAVASLSARQGKRLLTGDEEALGQLREALREIARRKRELLSSAGFAPEYLSPASVCDCPDCLDTGWIEGQKCHCFRLAEINLLYEQSHIHKILLMENFDALSYEYYQGEDLAHFKGAVDTCREYVRNFDSIYQNLFFYGTVGTGKSFLSGCVARELIETGHSVIYFSASGLFELLSRVSFNNKNKDELVDTYEDLYGCDLLMIDDLGTELTNSFVSSQLFSCLNERHMRTKSTVISTNLSLPELRDRYSERIFSRITSNYTVCKLSGPDIRIVRKRAAEQLSKNRK